MRGGKSELRRAGWSVIRTVPPKGDKESATENRPPSAPLVRSDELGVKSYEFNALNSELLTPNSEAVASVGKGEKAR